MHTIVFTKLFSNFFSIECKFFHFLDKISLSFACVVIILIYYTPDLARGSRIASRCLSGNCPPNWPDALVGSGNGLRTKKGTAYCRPPSLTCRFLQSRQLCTVRHQYISCFIELPTSTQSVWLVLYSLRQALSPRANGYYIAA